MTDRDITRDKAGREGVAKVIGADAELGNSIVGLIDPVGSGHEASRALLREFDGVLGNGQAQPTHCNGSVWISPSATHHDPQDVGRKFLASTGGCVYIDLDHLELCTPEVRSAYDFVAAWHAALRITQRALDAANARRPQHQRITVLVNSSDGLGNAYGSHLNFLVTRRLFDDMFLRRLHPSLFVLAAYQVSSIVLTGQGKVGAENGQPGVAYQLTQRGDFFEQLVGSQTTHSRPIVNARDEPLCGPRFGNNVVTGGGAGLARLHCIFYDSSLCHVTNLLKVGVMQIVLCMLESECFDASFMLADPLRALIAFGHDPSLRARATLSDGRAVSALELQAMFCARARAYVDAGGCADRVPDAAGIVELWESTLDLLARRDFDRLSSRLDWVAKRAQIERALSHRGLDWSAPEAKHLDHLYASLQRNEGIYWALEAAGCMHTLVDDSLVQRFESDPPHDTRAWTRSMLLRHIPRRRIRCVDWDAIELASLDGGEPNLRVSLPDPLGDTRAHWLGNRIERPSSIVDGGQIPDIDTPPLQ